MHARGGDVVGLQSIINGWYAATTVDIRLSMGGKTKTSTKTSAKHRTDVKNVRKDFGCESVYTIFLYDS